MLAPERKPAFVPKPYLATPASTETPRELLERCLAAIAEFEPEIGAFVHLDIAAAQQAADRATERRRAGKPLSPIDGMPIGIKDIIETADMPTQMGSPLFDGYRPDRDAASIAALRAAGAVIVGKTVTTEFAASEPRGTRNPWDPRRTPGGSSSGSAAAVAAGMLSTALGTQVVGSTIRPASYCGCVGFKPSMGALNRLGSHDSLSQSCTGVLATTLADAWQVAFEIAIRAGGDPGYPALAGPERAPPARKPPRLAFLETGGWGTASSEAKQAMQDALARLKAAGIEIVARQSNASVDAVETAIAGARAASNKINDWESRWPLNIYRQRDAGKLSKAMLERLARAEAMRPDDYSALLEERALVRKRYGSLAAECDGCVTLSAPAAAPMGLHSTGDAAFAVPFSLLGVPAISLPVLQDDGLPLGLQVTGFQQGDAATFAAAAAIAPLFGQRNA